VFTSVNKPSMREIKFRAWYIPQKQMQEWVGPDGLNGAKRYFTQMVDDPEIVLLQFTGLKDKNGKEIYEGDVIRSTWNHGIFKVEWDSHNGEWILCSDCSTTEGKYAGTEVIGNIYENPELLK
jgi:hypothetical protein